MGFMQVKGNKDQNPPVTKFDNKTYSSDQIETTWFKHNEHKQSSIIRENKQDSKE